MLWIELITLLAIGQLFLFSMSVGRARARHGLPLPAMSGNEMVERHIRGHLNSLEWIVIFLPALWIAAQHWGQYLVAGLGVIYLVGRTLYFLGYVRDIKKRMPGFVLSTLGALALVLLALVGVIRGLLVV
jgi:glutathione S-transferase